jgi:hypothetical protein
MCKTSNYNCFLFTDGGLRDYQKTENSCNLGADHDGPVNGDSMKKPKSANGSRTFCERKRPLVPQKKSPN